ncbi:MAG TPA: hypothetical protein VLC09_20095 [Polyangiaceae bacterium]|nr:hypothetical protein [Polyangiaceae bacterium]
MRAELAEALDAFLDGAPAGNRVVILTAATVKVIDTRDHLELWRPVRPGESVAEHLGDQLELVDDEPTLVDLHPITERPPANDLDFDLSDFDDRMAVAL